MESKTRQASSGFARFFVNRAVLTVGAVTFLLLAISAPDMDSIRTAFGIHAGMVLAVYPMQFYAMGKLTLGAAAASSLPGLTLLVAVYLRLFVVNDAWVGPLLLINFAVFAVGGVVIYRMVRRSSVRYWQPESGTHSPSE